MTLSERVTKRQVAFEESATGRGACRRSRAGRAVALKRAGARGRSLRRRGRVPGQAGSAPGSGGKGTRAARKGSGKPSGGLR